MKRGFTLSELVVVIGILGVLTLLVSTIIVRSMETYRFNREAAGYQEEAAKAIRDFEKSARGATLVLESTPIVFSFYVYMPKDDYPAPSRVRYFLSGGQIIRGEIKPSGSGPVFDYPLELETFKTIVKNVTNTEIFSYYNDVSDVIEDPVPEDAVRMTKISLTVDKDTNSPPLGITEETAINLRNVKTNL